MKKSLMTAVLIAGAITLTGCGASGPSLDDTQKTHLTDSLRQAQVNMDDGQAVEAARNACNAILDGKDTNGIAQVVKDQFKTDNQLQILLIADIVQKNGFCVK
jgi:predicted small lipoprotein YifL